jgi:hypothetical protein
VVGVNGLGSGGSGGTSGSGNPPARVGLTGGSGTVILAVQNSVYPGSAPGAVVSTPPATPGYTIITYTAPGTYTA